MPYLENFDGETFDGIDISGIGLEKVVETEMSPKEKKRFPAKKQAVTKPNKFPKVVGGQVGTLVDKDPVGYFMTFSRRDLVRLKLYAQSRGLTVSGILRDLVRSLFESESGFFGSVEPMVDILLSSKNSSHDE